MYVLIFFGPQEFGSRIFEFSKFLKLQHLVLFCQGKDLLNEPIRRDVREDVLEVNITGLQPDTTYSVQVAALTRKGDGDRSPPETVRTPGGVPNRPHVNVKYVLQHSFTFFGYIFSNDR